MPNGHEFGQVAAAADHHPRLPKGQIGEDTARLVGSLLLSGLWSAATRRSALPPEQRRDATVIVDECHNFLHLPMGMDDALPEARGYRVSLMLAHQHLAQLPPDVGHGLDANARNKIFFAVSPDDARHLVRHTLPVFDEFDLAARPGFLASVRVLHHGQAVPAFSIAALPLPDPPPGRDALIRQAARVIAGLTAAQRRHARHPHRPRPRLTGPGGSPPPRRRGQSPRRWSADPSAGPSATYTAAPHRTIAIAIAIAIAAGAGLRWREAAGSASMP